MRTTATLGRSPGRYGSEQDDSQCTINRQSATPGESAGESGSRHCWGCCALASGRGNRASFFFSQPVSVMNLDDLSKRFQIPFDGSLGKLPISNGLWNVIERSAMSIVGFLRDRQADILVGNEAGRRRPGHARSSRCWVGRGLSASHGRKRQRQSKCQPRQQQRKTIFVLSSLKCLAQFLPFEWSLQQ